MAWLALAAVALAGGLACERSGAPQESTPAQAASRVPEAPSGALGTPPGDAALPPLPAEGEVVVEVNGNRVTVAANQARRIAVLRKLADAAGFTLVVGRLRPVDPITYRAADRPVEEVLAELLAGVPYQIAYDVPRVKAGEGETAAPVPGHVLAQVTVGRFRSEAGRERRTRLARVRDAMQNKGLPGRRARERKQVDPAELERRRQEAEERRLAALATLRSDAPAEARLDAVDWLEPEGEELQLLAEIAIEDPDPRVRKAAVERLGSGDSALAASTLVQALSDPEPEVVIEALDAITFVGDESLVPELRPLLDHPDERVREAAQEAIEFLE